MCVRGTDGERLLRAGQVAGLFGVSRRTVNEWASRGVIPGFRVMESGHWRFRESDVLALLEITRKGGQSCPVCSRPRSSRRASA